MGKKLTAAWRIITSGKSLEARMRLIIDLQMFLEHLNDELEALAVKKGQADTIRALRAVAIEQAERYGSKES